MNTPSINITVNGVVCNNVVQYVTTALQFMGHPRPQEWALSLPPIEHLPLEVQIAMVNRELRYAFTLIPGNTMDARYCIVDNVPFEKWRELMESTVLKFLASHASAT